MYAPDVGPGEAAAAGALRAARERLLGALGQCDASDEQYPTAAISRAIDACSGTIDALEAGRALCGDLRAFRLRVTVPATSSRAPARIAIRLDQMRVSKPLEVNDYVVIRPPVGPALTTPRVAARNCFFNYAHAFEIPDRSPRSIALAKAADVEFAIWRYTAHFEVRIGHGTAELLASGRVPLLPLCFAAMSTAHIEFKTPDGEKTYYAFETTMRTAEPLVPGTRELIDEEIRLLGVSK
jgi:hypothetical protein